MAVPQSFPAKIYQILENESADIIRWNNDGCSFRIVDHGRFEREIVPKYFRHNQISSVQRQLNLYGFKCISRGELRRSFFHPRFKRGEWDVVKKLTRYIPPKKSSPFPDSNNYPYDGNIAHIPRPSDPSFNNPVTQQQQQPQSQQYPNLALNYPMVGFDMDCSKQQPGSTDNTPRDSKPSELAMRLGFRHSGNGTSDPGSGGSVSSMASSNSSTAATCKQQQLMPQQQQQQGTVAQPHANMHNDFELMKEFDFFDHFGDFDFHCDPSSSMVKATTITQPPTSNNTAATTTSSTSTSGMYPNGPISFKPAAEKVVVLPIPAAPTAAPQHSAAKTTRDASCMTDLVFSEAHGGFIYQ